MSSTTPSTRAQEIIRAKRDGHALQPTQIDAFVQGLVTRRWSEGQVAALAMAICVRGMTRSETARLTQSMAASGQRFDWSRQSWPGPLLDKHSTGGVGDKVSLVLAPLLAACGAVVPMVSGRGLGHTGGTLDKLESLPGYRTTPDRATLLRALREAGCAIVGASARIAPADRRLYAIRDATGTVESLPLITASILSKKLAAGVQRLLIDVKLGSGAFCTTHTEARALAESLVAVAGDAGLPTRALITDMDSVLGTTVGNALEVRESIDFITGRARDARLLDVTLALAGQLLHLGGLATSPRQGEQHARAALDGGAAAQRFARMVAALGGPHDALERADARLARAPVQRPLPARRDGVVTALDTRAIALAVVALGGGRARAGDAIDVRVGLSDVRGIGARITRDEPLAVVHAASGDSAEAALQALGPAWRIGEHAEVPRMVHAVIGT
ncbi:MAG TPA: thymidine phosphorylase [Burkholderiaceae bacterium]|nr:thymidine phosphorylase [Burkholderiaceae bacterium]